MSLEPATYRCFVARSRSGFRAVCIDLDLAAENETLYAAIIGLREAVQGYLAVVQDGTATNQAFQPYREAPLLEKLRWLFGFRFTESGE
jgi:hypothetical protein